MATQFIATPPAMQSASSPVRRRAVLEHALYACGNVRVALFVRRHAVRALARRIEAQRTIGRAWRAEQLDEARGERLPIERLEAEVRRIDAVRAVVFDRDDAANRLFEARFAEARERHGAAFGVARREAQKRREGRVHEAERVRIVDLQ
jgi:hypothetical protein